MTKTHYKTLINPDYLGAYAVEDGKDLVLTIDKILSEVITGTGGKKETCPVMHFVEQVKPMIVNSTNFKMMKRLFQSPFIEDWYGKKIAIYADRNVKFGGELVEGLRIRPTLPTGTPDTACADCGEIIADTERYSAKSIVQASRSKYGVPLCMVCATARKSKPEQAAAE